MKLIAELTIPEELAKAIAESVMEQLRPFLAENVARNPVPEVLDKKVLPLT
jgi:hypothetical protein